MPGSRNRAAYRRLTRTVLIWIGLVVPACALLITGGCTAAEAEHRQAASIESAVRAYNDALSRAFVMLDMNELSRFATEEQAAREFYLMAALGEGRVQMFATLTSIEFGEVTFSEEGKAAVTTTEVWDYDHVSLDTSQTVRSERGVVYRLEYALVLRDGRWLVSGVTSLDDGVSRESTSSERSSGP